MGRAWLVEQNNKKGWEVAHGCVCAGTGRASAGTGRASLYGFDTLFFDNMHGLGFVRHGRA